MKKIVVLLMVFVLAISTGATFAQDPVEHTAPTDDLFTQVYDAVSPSVVSINVVKEVSNGAFGQNGIVGASGSGFLIDPTGYIVTNNHVVADSQRIEVNFFDGTISGAKIVGTDPDSDIAVIQVEDLPSEVVPAQFGDSDALEIGQTVLAIGSPFGQRWTLTSGIVSALQRTIQGLTDFSVGSVIQTDTSINPGNSGGPLLDLDGRVVGVNSQILSESGSSSGIGFAIPSNLVQKVAAELIDKGFVEYSYLGLSGGDINLNLIDAFDLAHNTQGVVVASVVPGAPADRAGLLSAGETKGEGLDAVPSSIDIITAIDGHQLTGMGDLISYLAQNTNPGQKVTLDVLRNGTDNIQVEVSLTPRP